MRASGDPLGSGIMWFAGKAEAGMTATLFRTKICFFGLFPVCSIRSGHQIASHPIGKAAGCERLCTGRATQLDLTHLLRRGHCRCPVFLPHPEMFASCVLAGSSYLLDGARRCRNACPSWPAYIQPDVRRSKEGCETCQRRVSPPSCDCCVWPVVGKHREPHCVGM
jgi:hypothetical protein